MFQWKTTGITLMGLLLNRLQREDMLHHLGNTSNFIISPFSNCRDLLIYLILLRQPGIPPFSCFLKNIWQDALATKASFVRELVDNYSLDVRREDNDNSWDCCAALSAQLVGVKSVNARKLRSDWIWTADMPQWEVHIGWCVETGKWDTK